MSKNIPALEAAVESLKAAETPKETPKTLSQKLKEKNALDLGEMDYEIKLKELYEGGDVSKDNIIDPEYEKKLEENGPTGLYFMQNVADRYVKEEPEKIDQYLGRGHEKLIKYDADTKIVKANVNEIVDKIGVYTENLGIPTDEFVDKLKQIKKEIDIEKHIGEEDRARKISTNTDSLENARLVGWLVEQLHILRLYDEKKRELDEKKAILAERRSIKKGDVHLENMVSRPSAFDIWKLSDDVSKREIEFKRLISAYGDVTRKESYDQSKLKPVKKLRNEDFVKALSSFKENIAEPIAHAITNPILAGLMTGTDPKKTELFLKTIADEKGKIGGLFKKFGINIGSGKIDIEAIKSDLARQKHSGFLTPEEVSELMQFYKELAEGDKKKQDFIDALQKDVNKFNAGVEAKIAAAEVTDDDLNKLRLIQAALLLSPFFGISLVPIAAGAFLPFFEGMEMADWVASFLSADGPLAWMGIPHVTDWLRLDEAAAGFLHLFDGVWSLPEAVLTGENNPISILFRNVIGEGMANSPFGNWVIALFVNQYSHHLEREAKLTKDKDGILQSAKKGLEQLYAQYDKEGKKAGLDKLFDKTKNVVEYRTNLAIASKMSVWLQTKHSRYPDACKEFVEQVFAKDAKLKDEILGILKAITAAKEMPAANDEQKKAIDKANLEFLQLFVRELQKDKSTAEIEQLLEICFAKNQDPINVFFNSSEQRPDVVKRMNILKEKVDEAIRKKEDVGYDEKLEILRARGKIELAGQYGVNTGHPLSYGEGILVCEKLNNLNIDKESQLSKDLHIPNFDPSTRWIGGYDKNLLDDLILLDNLKNTNEPEYKKIVASGLGDNETLKDYLLKNNLMEENQAEELVNSSSMEVKKRVVALQDCLRRRDSKDSRDKNKTDDELYQECLENLSNHTSSQIDIEYERVNNEYDDRVVRVAAKIKEESFNRNLTPTTSITRFNNEVALSATQLVDSTKEFGR